MIRFGDVLLGVFPALQANLASELVFWTEEELVEYLAEGARLLGKMGVFVDREEIPVDLDALYTLPERTLSMIHVAIDGASLRGINVGELDALDPNWRVTAPTTPTHFAGDVHGMGIVNLYPPPEAEGSAAIIRHTYPAVESAASTARGAEVFADCLKYHALAEARGKEGDAQMPDVAAHARERTELYRAVFRQYWTEAE